VFDKKSSEIEIIMRAVLKLFSVPLKGTSSLCQMNTLSRRSMSCVRDLENETTGDECLSTYKYFYNPELLKDQVAFVTGGGSGIGFRITELLMRHGCKTVIGSRKLERVEEAASKLMKATGGECLPLQCDVRDYEQVKGSFDQALQHYGKLNCLVNNAAGNFLAPAGSLSSNAYKTVLEIDTLGTFNASKAAYETYFKENGGNIVNITATLYYSGTLLQMHAGSAKAAIDAMTKHLGAEWGFDNVRVNAIAPGPIDGTVGMNKLGGKSPIANEMKKAIPLQRFGLKTEIAESVLYLASDISSYVTGSVMVVDGGHWLTANNDPRIVRMLMNF